MHMKSKVCILQSSYDGSDAQCAELDPPGTPELWMDKEKYDIHSVSLKKSTSAKELIQLAAQNFDCFINLCDGAFDEDRAGIEVVQALEKLNVPYTGADLYSYDPSRERMKRAAISCGESTPNWMFCKTMEEVEDALQELTFPLITKHFAGYNSVGLTKDSKCTDPEGFRKEAMRFIELFGEVLVEEFVDGPEFTVLVAQNPNDYNNPIVYQPIQCQFPEGETFKHFQLKWVDYEGLKWFPVKDPTLDARLREMSSKIFVTLRQKGYGRLDIRMDSKTGKLMFLEINPNCGVFYPPGLYGSADEILEIDETTSHAIFIDTIIQSAQKKYSEKQKNFCIKFKKEKGFGMYASRDIMKGEIVEELEEKATHLVSVKHVEKYWSAKLQKSFREYCYPISSEIYGMWSKDIDDWKPINHSCEPNLWLEGLNTVACVDIRKDTELTLDYATFCVDSEPFNCGCGSSSCRKVITGKEYLDKTILSKYGSHVSDYILNYHNEL